MNRSQRENYIKKINKHSGVRTLTVLLFIFASIIFAFVIFLLILNQSGTITKLPDGSIKLIEIINSKIL